MQRIYLFTLGAMLMLAGCQESQDHTSHNEGAEKDQQEVSPDDDTLFVVKDPVFETLFNTEATLDTLGKGYAWSEGPVWISSHNMLLFSDIPNNQVLVWTDSTGVQNYLQPSGYTGSTPLKGEPGANGLFVTEGEELILAQHGDRRIALMNASLDDPTSDFETIADAYDGKKLNSPNDVIADSKGNFYFTDPPYGLEEQEDDPKKELDFQGVYKVTPEGKVILLTKELSRPNGLCLSNDEKTLYVTNSDPKKAICMQYDLDKDGVSNKKIFFDLTDLTLSEEGLPDGIKVGKKGNVYSTGPGGIFVFSPKGKELGHIKMGKKTANLTFDDEENFLYITAHDHLFRLPLK